MGCCFSSKPSKQNDMNFQLLKKPQRGSIKILFLGASESGKTTIIKQLQNIHNINDIGHIYSKAIQDILVTSMKTLCQESITFSETETSVHRHNQLARDYILALHSPYSIADITIKLKLLWRDEGIQATLAKRHEFQIADNIEYFLDKIDDICCDNYLPSFEDSVRISQRSIGCASVKFVPFIDGYGEYEFEVLDVAGSRSERRKWWQPNVISDVCAIIYVVAISEYNQVLFEDNETNRLIESLNLFKTVMNQLTQNIQILTKNIFVIVLFNKYDLFQQKIKSIPIKISNFPKNMNPNDSQDVDKFIATQFCEIFHDRIIAHSNNKTHLRILRTIAIDQENIQDIFTMIAWDIIQKRYANDNIENVNDDSKMENIDESYMDNYSQSEMDNKQSTNNAWWSWNNHHGKQRSVSTTNATTGSQFALTEVTKRDSIVCDAETDNISDFETEECYIDSVLLKSKQYELFGLYQKSKQDFFKECSKLDIHGENLNLVIDHFEKLNEMI